jgi:hypothetical protein
MERGLLFFTLALLCVWAVLDEFWGKKKISEIAAKLTPTTKPVTWKDDEQANEDKENTKDKIDRSDDMSEDAKKKLKEAVDKFYEPSREY